MTLKNQKQNEVSAQITRFNLYKELDINNQIIEGSVYNNYKLFEK